MKFQTTLDKLTTFVFPETMSNKQNLCLTVILLTHLFYIYCVIIVTIKSRILMVGKSYSRRSR